MPEQVAKKYFFGSWLLCQNNTYKKVDELAVLDYFPEKDIDCGSEGCQIDLTQIIQQHKALQLNKIPATFVSSLSALVRIGHQLESRLNSFRRHRY